MFLSEDDGFSIALLLEELSKERAPLLLDQPAELKKMDTVLDGISENIMRRTKHNPDIKAVLTCILCNWGDYHATLGGFSKSNMTKGLFLFHEVDDSLDELKRQDMDEAHAEILASGEDLSYVFQGYVKEIDGAKFTCNQKKANTRIRKYLCQKYPNSAAPMTRVTACYATNIAGFEAFASNVGLDKNLTKDIKERLFNYYTTKCIPSLMAALNGAEPTKTPSKTPLKSKTPTKTNPTNESINIEDNMTDCITKIIKQVGFREMIRKISFSNGNICFLMDWLKKFTNWEEVIPQVFGNSVGYNRQHFLSPMSVEDYFHVLATGPNLYGKSTRVSALVVNTQDVPEEIRCAIIANINDYGIQLEDKGPETDIGKALSSHFGEHNANKIVREILSNIVNMSKKRTKEQMQEVEDYMKNQTQSERDDNNGGGEQNSTKKRKMS
jgi:hypothetical protein